MKKLIVLSLFLFATLFAEEKKEEEGWVSLFDGKTIEGWENPYTFGTVEVKNGEIHLTANKKFFLCTKKKYADFIFEAEIQLPEGKSNSGILFRCHKQKELGQVACMTKVVVAGYILKSLIIPHLAMNSERRPKVHLSAMNSINIAFTV